MMANQSIKDRYFQLRSYFRKGQDVQIISMLTQDLDESDHHGTLLHCAVRELALATSGMPLDTTIHPAVSERISIAIVKALLGANARIDIPDRGGRTALQLLLESSRGWVLKGSIELFVRRLERDCRNDEELVEALSNAGCTLYQAVCSRNLKLIKGLLKRDDRAPYGPGPLYEAVRGGQVELVHLLLEHGADPNAAILPRITPLYGALKKATRLTRSLDEVERYDNCIELLLQNGAIPEDPRHGPSHFEYALEMASESNGMKYLICQLALLDRLGTSVSSSIMRYRGEKYRERFTEAEKYYELCQQILCRAEYEYDTEYEALSLFELLTVSDEKMKTYARNLTLMNKIEDICTELSASHLYYAKTLRKRFCRAADRIELENAAIKILCKLFNTDYNQCPIFARSVVGYLSERDLKHLCQIFDTSVPLVEAKQDDQS